MDTIENDQGSSSEGVPPPSPAPMAAQFQAPDVAETCATCGSAPNGTRTLNYVYALGTVAPRFPRLAVEKEFTQITGSAKTAGLTDRQALHTILSERQNRYIARQICWVMTIESVETYILVPRDPADFDLLVNAIRSDPSPEDIDLVVGVRGPVAGPDVCNGLMIPIVLFDNVYSFDRDSLITSIPRPPKVSGKEAKTFRSAAVEVLDRVMQMADNAGATDDHRALNYLVVRYPAIYATTGEAYGRNCSLTGVDVRPSALNGVRRIVDVIFSYTNRSTDVTEKYFVRVDVTEEFPFLVTKMSAYYDR